MIKDILKDSLYYLISKSIVGVLSLLVIWLTLKIYGVSQYGEFSVLYVLALTISNLCFTWLAQSYIRMNRHNDYDKRLLQAGLIGSTILCAIIVYVGSFLLEYQYIACVLLALTSGFYSVGRSLLQSERKIKVFFYYDLFRIVIQIICAYVFSFFFKGINGLIIACSLSCFIFIMTFKPAFSIGLRIESFSGLKEGLLNWLKFGLPVAVWITIASGQLLVDRKIIITFLNTYELGIYSAIYDSVVKICALIVIPLSNACYPILVFNETANINYKKIGCYLSLVSVAIASVSALLVYNSYDFIVNFINIGLSKKDLGILIFGIILWQLGLLYQKPLEMQKKTYAMLINIVLCLIISVVVNLNFVSALGISIFPISVAISSLCYLMLTYIWIEK
ncbi:hypothetical protein SK58_02037 [Enterobacter sp. BIDMC93]|uniref:lipopolysaccharide biosynthesis protein n=1 Tax=Enterobacter sp. BIDMC93 TaxID=1686396 RepID=UPI0006517F97|nr:oligosaccharide flippase family protein [Enterobacter sp. BIDMC93]KLW61338.1 hypothetical protein SK58_02037 [Enterobacter sp. BIDMC93]